jgi:hypothetical protein
MASPKTVVVTKFLLLPFLTASFFSHAQNVGIGTVTPIARLHVADSAVVFTNNRAVFPASFAPPPVQGKGIRMMWYPQKGAFRAGAIDDGPLVGEPAGTYPVNDWNKDSIGILSFASGFNTRAKGDFSFASGLVTSATGFGATTMGILTTANGDGATAMGQETIASGTLSTAIGAQTTASGYLSFAAGDQSIASAGNTTAIGHQAIASGTRSTALGNYVSTNSYSGAFIIGDNNSNALGNTRANEMMMRFNGGYRFYLGNTDLAMFIHPLGRIGIGTSDPRFPLSFNEDLGDKIALWSNSPNSYGFGIQSGQLQIHTDIAVSDIVFGYGSSTALNETMRIKGNGNVGIGTNAPLARLHVKDNSILFSADNDIPVTPGSPPQQGIGRRMMWYADKAAFRAGCAIGTEWDQANIGNYSFAAGNFTLASGARSSALGYGAFASGNSSLATGEATTASGETSTAMGNSTTASGLASTAMGFGTIAKAAGSLSIGTFNDDTDSPNAFSFNPDDRLFQIGNGNGPPKSNALTVLRNGRTGIGTTTPLTNLHVFGGASGNTSPFSQMAVEGSGNTYINLLSPNANETGILFGKASDAASGGIIYNNTPNAFQFRTNGNITRLTIFNNGNATLTGTLTQSSDSRLKKNITHLKNSLQKIIHLNGYNYFWKSENADNSLQTGILAQEVQTLFPELVKEGQDGILSVNYSGLIPVMIESIKEQQQQIEELKKLVEKLLKK